MAPHSSTLAWKIPWTEEPGGLQSMGSLRVRHDWVTSLHFSVSCIGEGNGNPLQCSCLENPRDGEPGGLLSMGSHRVGHDWSDSAAAAYLARVTGNFQFPIIKVSCCLNSVQHCWSFFLLETLYSLEFYIPLDITFPDYLSGCPKINPST